MSRRTLTRHFIKATGMSVADWLTAEPAAQPDPP
jgi:transcriptional regulator GlxA family with amidase domain